MPTLYGRRATRAPARSASAWVPSVDPSSMTRISSPGSTARISSITRAIVGASFRAGTIATRRTATIRSSWATGSVSATALTRPRFYGASISTSLAVCKASVGTHGGCPACARGSGDDGGHDSNSAPVGLSIPRPRAPGLALCALIVCSVLGRFWVNGSFEGPQIYCDEYIYAAIARDFATSGHLQFQGGPAAGGALLYPILIAPAWLAHAMSTTFDLVKLINAALVSLTAAPVYLWAKRVVSPWWSLVAAALVLLLPGFVLSGMAMCENAALPTFT